MRGAVRQASIRANASIAPALTQKLHPWLPRVTSGRYADVRVDPNSLLVEVRKPAGRMRAATVLSHGTMEQVYLLLRLALAEPRVATARRSAFVTVSRARTRSGRLPSRA